MTQAEAAEKARAVAAGRGIRLKLHSQTLSDYERGVIKKVPLAVLESLAPVYGVTVGELLGATDDGRLGRKAEAEQPYRRRTAYEPELPRRLEIMALDFEKWAMEQGADRAFMRYVRSSLREPDFVALFAGGPDESMMNPEQAENEMRAHVDELKTMLRRRLKRAAAISGKLAPKEEE